MCLLVREFLVRNLLEEIRNCSARRARYWLYLIANVTRFCSTVPSRSRRNHADFFRHQRSQAANLTTIGPRLTVSLHRVAPSTLGAAGFIRERPSVTPRQRRG